MKINNFSRQLFNFRRDPAKAGKFLIAILTFEFCVFNFLGCAAFPKRGEVKASAALEPAMMMKFTDIPFPSKFKALPAESYSFESQGVRVGVLKYQGRAEPDKVVNFYKEQMAMYNWTLLNIIEYGQRLLSFERDNEICIINIIPKTIGNVLVTISLGPKSQTLPKKTEKPLK